MKFIFKYDLNDNIFNLEKDPIKNRIYKIELCGVNLTDYVLDINTECSEHTVNNFGNSKMIVPKIMTVNIEIKNNTPKKIIEYIKQIKLINNIKL